MLVFFFFFFSSRRRHTRCLSDWSSDVCSSDLSKNGTFVNNIPLKARLILKPGDRVTAGHLVIVYAPDAAGPPGVVVFEGETGSATTSTVVTSLEGGCSNQP